MANIGKSAAGRRGVRTDRVALPFCCLSLTAPKPKSESYPENPETVGEHIRKRRMDLCLLQRQVADEIGVHVYTLCLWELGRHEPEIRHWPGIIAFLGYDPTPEGRTVGERVRRLRRSLGLTQKRLAQKLGLDEHTVTNVERGRRCVHKRTREAIEGFLGEA